MLPGVNEILKSAKEMNFQGRVVVLSKEDLTRFFGPMFESMPALFESLPGFHSVE